MPKTFIETHIDEIARFAELERFIDMPVKHYSSGMYLRLGFSIATNLNPDILLIDEVLAVGDGYFQHKCLDKVREFKLQQKTIVLVSHDLSMVQKFCDRAIYLEREKLKKRDLPVPLQRITPKKF